MDNFYSNSYIDFYQAMEGVNPLRNLNEIKNSDINVDIKVIETKSRNKNLSEFEKEIINQKSCLFEFQKELNPEVKHNNSEAKNTLEKKIDIKSYYSVPKGLIQNENNLVVSSKKFKADLDPENIFKTQSKENNVLINSKYSDDYYRNQSHQNIFKPFIGSGPIEAYEIDNRSRSNRNIFKKSSRKSRYKLSSFPTLNATNDTFF